MFAFWKSADEKEKDIKQDTKQDYSNNLGKELTTIENAKNALYFEPKIFNPLELIDISKGVLCGVEHSKDGEQIPIYIPEEAINHELYVGITRSGKGVQSAVRAVETLRHDNRGLIYIDVKKEKFTPQVIKEELKRQGKEKDLEIVTFPNDFGYSGFNKDDSITEVWEKICVALSIEPVDDVKSEHYRRVERQTLLKLLKIAWAEYSYFKLEWNHILTFIEALTEDFKKIKKLNEESEKAKPDYKKVDDLKKQFFTEDFYTKLNFSKKNIEALETIYIKLYELLMSGTYHNKYTLDNALFNGKVLYIRADMENTASLQFLKVLFKDLSQKARKADRKGITANCKIIADEISFYVTQNLAGALSTMAGFGVRYLLQLQDISQIADTNIRASILTNCSLKLFYKISDPLTLNYVEILGGKESVINVQHKGSLENSFSVNVEPYINATRVRALWYKLNAVLIAEYLNTALFIGTSFIPVENEFNWKDIEEKEIVLEPFIFEHHNSKNNIEKEVSKLANNNTPTENKTPVTTPADTKEEDLKTDPNDEDF